MRRHEGGAKARRRREQRIHVGILGPAQSQRVEAGLGEEGGGINRARVGNVEHDGHRLCRRFDDDESGVELVDEGWTHPGHWFF